ncbi:MAG: hypothetical protein BGO58_00610 [Sphingopyxis sp. 65-8]|mgnify:FL=1|nr:hypothetical protein [Sphingopyxis terrae]OJW27925.1 MAG: hypothetical protein BGO58_00610 [Sphingopyxis sp. 65-8]HRE33452.1 hypothetical protein [Sphingopyxis terrae]
MDEIANTLRRGATAQIAGKFCAMGAIDRLDARPGAKALPIVRWQGVAFRDAAPALLLVELFLGDRSDANVIV